jgi:hypothetical protein
MRSRIGGFIGPPRRPAFNVNYGISSASGMWTLGEQHSSRTENQWPRNYIDISFYSSVVDTTWGGGATALSANVTYSLGKYDADGNPVPPAYSWEKSTNGGSTWSTVAGETASSVELSGITATSLYRLRAAFGIRTKVSSPVEVRFETSFTNVNWYPPPDFSGPVGSEANFYSQIQDLTGLTHGGIYYNPGAYPGLGEVQWQQSTNGGSTWADIAGQTTYFLYVPINSGMNGRKYRIRSRVSSAHAWLDGPAATLFITP